MKKLLAILLALTMIFAFAACGSTPSEEDVRGEQNVNTTEASTPADNNTPAGDTVDTPTEETTEPEFSLGAVEGLNYENKFIGIGCNLPSGWTFYTDEQIREINNITTDYLDEEYQEILSNAQLIYDMLAASSDQVSSVHVTLQKVDPITLAMMDLSESFEQSIPTIKQNLENMGATITETKIDTVMIDGEEFDCLKATAEISGLKVNLLNFGKKCNGYLASVVITTMGDAALQELLNSFYVIK